MSFNCRLSAFVSSITSVEIVIIGSVTSQKKVFEKYICVGLSEQAQIVGDKILAAKKAKKKKVDM